MNLSKQIGKYRERDGYSQEYLAERLYVSRQGISNRENDKNLPDIYDLLMMCELFNVTLDNLVKRTIPFVPDIKTQRNLNLWVYVMLILMTLAAILMGPLIVYWNQTWGVAVIIILGAGFYAPMKIEGLKRAYKMDNYGRTVAFISGKDPSEVQTTKARNTMTSALSIISVIGILGLIIFLSVYLANKFL